MLNKFRHHFYIYSVISGEGNYYFIVKHAKGTILDYFYLLICTIVYDYSETYMKQIMILWYFCGNTLFLTNTFKAPYITVNQKTALFHHLTNLKLIVAIYLLLANCPHGEEDNTVVGKVKPRPIS